MHCSRRLIVQTLVFSRSYLHRRVSPPGNLVVKGGTTWARNGRWILPENARLPRNIQGSFTCRKSTTWDNRLYFPSEGRRAEDILALKNPTASAGFEPANLGTKGQVRKIYTQIHYTVLYLWMYLVYVRFRLPVLIFPFVSYQTATANVSLRLYYKAKRKLNYIIRSIRALRPHILLCIT